MLDKLRGAARRLLGASFASYEARFRATFEHAAVGMAHTTIDGRWLEVNDRLCEITGYPRPELMQHHFRDFTPPEDWAQDAEQRRRVLAGEVASYRRQKRYIRKDGSLVWVAITGWLARRPDGRPDFFIATIEDISRAKEAELALASSNRLLDGVIENLPAMVFMKRASDLRFVRLNRAGEKLLGYARSELLNKSDYDFFSKERADFFTSIDREVLTSDVVREISEEPVCTREGRTRYLTTAKSALRDADGRPTHLLGVSIDITERKEIEERLRLSEERYRMALTAGRLGTFDWDIDKDVVHWDERSLAAMGLPPDAMLDYARSLEFAHPDDRAGLAAAIARALDPKTTEPFVHEWRSLRPDGTTRWTETQGRAYFTGDGQQRRAIRLVGAARDITRRKLAEEHIKLLMREVSHRSKNLLTVVQALARHTANEVDPHVFAERFGQRLAALAASQDLLVKSDWRGADVADLIRSQLGHLGDLVGTRATFTGPPLRLTSAAAQAIGMALHELATNAIKYGALSDNRGQVRIVWRKVANGGAPHVRLVWSEHDGPPVRAPCRRGFGHTVMVDILEHELDADVRLSYTQAGVVWEMSAPAQRAMEEVSSRSA